MFFKTNVDMVESATDSQVLGETVAMKIVQRQPRLATVLCAVIAAFPLLAFACSVVLPRAPDFDEREYIFYGQVIGYSALRDRVCGRGGGYECETWGLKVSVLAPVYMPKQDTTLVELYEFGVESNCARLPMAKDAVAKIPLGSRYMVVAKELRIHSQYLDSGSIRLLVGYPQLLSILAREDVAQLSASAADYSLRDSTGMERQQFELRKDFVRLRGATATPQRVEILGRMSDYDWGCVSDYQSLVSRYITDPSAIEALVARHRARRPAWTQAGCTLPSGSPP